MIRHNLEEPAVLTWYLVPKLPPSTEINGCFLKTTKTPKHFSASTQVFFRFGGSGYIRLSPYFLVSGEAGSNRCFGCLSQKYSLVLHYLGLLSVCILWWEVGTTLIDINAYIPLCACLDSTVCPYCSLWTILEVTSNLNSFAVFISLDFTTDVLRRSLTDTQAVLKHTVIIFESIVFFLF